jgi:hypothetical protein
MLNKYSENTVYQCFVNNQKKHRKVPDQDENHKAPKYFGKEECKFIVELIHTNMYCYMFNMQKCFFFFTKHAKMIYVVDNAQIMNKLITNIKFIVKLKVYII